MLHSLSRLFIFTLFLYAAWQLLPPWRQWRPQLRLTLLAFFLLALGELLAVALTPFRPALVEFPLRNFAEIAALLAISFSCNYEIHRRDRKNFVKTVVTYVLGLVLPVGFYFLFSAELSKVLIYGLEVVYFSRYLISATERVDDSFQKRDLYILGASFLLLLLDLFLRLWTDYMNPGEGYSGICFTAAAAGFSAAFLSHVARENRLQSARAIATRDREIEIFADITKKLNSNFTLNALLDTFVVEICNILDGYSAAIYIDRKLLAGRAVEERLSGELQCAAVHGFYPPVFSVNERAVTKIEFLHKAVRTTTVQRGDGVVGQAYASGKAELLRDLDRDPGFTQTIPKIATIKTLITMPLLRQGMVFGVLQICNRNDGENFTEADFKFADMIVDQASLAIYNTFLMQERERKLETETDLKAAQEIQLSLIPKHTPTVPGMDLGKYFSPTKQIGGDYYDFIEIDPTHLGVIIADVSGKGVAGGLVMSVMRTVMRMVTEIKDANIYSPKYVLTELNKGVSIAVKEKHMFITVLYCIFDTVARTVKICRAGHNPLLHVKGGEIQAYKPEGIALGIIDSATFSKLTRESEVPYAPGDSFFLYTDGVVEEFDKNKQMFGDERLRTYLRRNAGEESAKVISGLVRDLNAFRGEDQDQHDDIAIINVRVL